MRYPCVVDKHNPSTILDLRHSQRNLGHDLLFGELPSKYRNISNRLGYIRGNQNPHPRGIQNPKLGGNQNFLFKEIKFPCWGNPKPFNEKLK